jgi:hypothetical protein
MPARAPSGPVRSDRVVCPSVVCLGVLGLLGLAGCGFSPRIASGSLACDGQSCPRGLICSATGRCCAPGDEQEACAGPAAKADSGRPPAADAQVAGGGAESDGASRPTGAPDGGPDPTDGGPAASGRWPRLVAGSVRVMSPFGGCSFGRAAASNDRWCGFYRGTELWVLNATRAAASGSVRCDGTDSGCLRLSQNAFRADASSVAADAVSTFYGELLVYHADARQSSVEPFRGGVYAWRPGWAQGRRLTSPNGTSCQANDLDASTVVCQDNRDGDQVDYLGGRLPLEGMTLPRIERVSDSRSEVRLTFSGDYIVYSWAAQIDQPSNLYAVAAGQVANPGARILLASDARLLSVGDNGTKAYFLRIDPMTGTGVLMRVDVPTGRNVIEMARGIQLAANAGFTGGQELGLMTAENLDNNGDADLRLFWDVAAPQSSVLVGRTWLGGMSFSADGRFFFLLSPQPSSPLMEARVFDTRTRKSCVLGTTGRVRGVVDGFSPDGRIAFWDKNMGNWPREAWAASTADCSPIRQLGSSVTTSLVLDGGGVVFRDDVTSEETGKLRFVPTGEDFATAAVQVIDDQTNVAFSVIGDAGASMVLYTSSAPGREGLYLAKVPF